MDEELISVGGNVEENFRSVFHDEHIALSSSIDLQKTNNSSSSNNHIIGSNDMFTEASRLWNGLFADVFSRTESLAGINQQQIEVNYSYKITLLSYYHLIITYYIYIYTSILLGYKPFK